MATSAERQVLGFLLLVALGGGARRLFEARYLSRAVAQSASRPLVGASAGQLLAAQQQAVDSLRAVTKPARSRSKRRLRTDPANLPEVDSDRFPENAKNLPERPLDVNRATAAELEALPRVGPALAARIVAWRQAHGPFGSLDDLRHVRGIGPATARRLAPVVTFSGRHSP